ncbi:type III-B CRISPR module RAMP protein Cmr1 [Thermus filiformis]|uniref:CRISPR-associated protein Cmr1 n=1 Tax=Thermus filiformis TaxID=276 RepID=A0A0A2WMG2_THEFI|nr:type III-B CRISPR module RAMP protein Cmr1 [Thermus filiformis]KGQ21371.1 CRISPR-associated protein Cmr1 [Thermus filiformis]
MREWREAYTLSKRKTDEVVLERTYRLLTPLFGGGVEPKKADPVSVVRATEVRGQLRFWWRAVRGWRSGGRLEELWKLEAQIFGSAGEGGASPLWVAVETLEEGREVEIKEIKEKGRVVQWYLGFPLRDGKVWSPVREGVCFRLRLRFPEALKEEVEAALWAWQTFGGLGARTRRGFGALALEGAPSPDEKEVREGLKRYSQEGGWPPDVPHLTPGSLVRVVNLPWRALAERYQAFRQDRNPGQGNQPGRSRWPEPDEVRRLQNRHAQKHPPCHPVRKFPRGQFGLPIIFHFKDGGDPEDATLQGQEADRLASPLLFRPLDEGRCLVAVLEAPRVPPGGVVLRWGNGGKSVQVELTPQEAAEIPVLKRKTDPLRAFVESL